MKRVIWPAAVVLVTGAYSLIPLLGSRDVYMRGDSAAQFAPTWFHLGEMVRGGAWPPSMDPDAFAGGNYAAEGLFGIYNPLNLLIWLGVSGAGDLMVAVTAVKCLALVMLALGTYLVCREYDAAPWAAAAVATALPFSGFTLWWDAGSWPAGLFAFAYAPWVWWSFRKATRGTLNPFWAFLAGVLAVTNGNPYGTLAVAVIGFGLLVECLANRNRAGSVRLLLTGGCVAAFLPLVYLPLLRTSELAGRTTGPLIENTERLRPNLGDLLGFSNPTFVPGIDAVTGPMQVPATYFCWFLLPLLPWLQYSALRQHARAMASVAVVGLIYLLMTLGPSDLWMFRWPLRLIEYFWLAVGVAFSVLLSKGLERNHWPRRLSATAALVAYASFQAWAQEPLWTSVAFGGAAMLILLTVIMTAWLRWGPPTPALLAVLLIAGTGVALVGQAKIFHENESSRVYHVPSDVSLLEDRFGDLDGRIIQFADMRPLQEPNHDRALRAAWLDFLPGSLYHVAGVEAVNNYTGMGFRPFERQLCLHYEGFTKPCGYRNIWKPVAPGLPPLADLLKLRTIVVATNQSVGVTPAADWRTGEVDARTVLTRTSPLPWPDSRLSFAEPGITVTGARTVDDVSEVVHVNAPGGGELVFAMLAWPGYTASLDGRPLEVRHDTAGLLSVDLPAGVEGTLKLSYRTPGLKIGLAFAGAGTLVALLLGVLHIRGRRRGSGPRPEAAEA